MKSNAMWKLLGAPALAMVAAGLVVTQLPLNAQAASVVKSGTDDALTWSIDSDGKLLVEGVGDYAMYEPKWIQYADLIKSAELHVSGMRDASYLFMNCSNMTSVDLSDFDTSKTNYMGSMFLGCSSLTSIDLSGFDTSNVSEMCYMFCDCRSLTNLDVSSFDTSNVNDMRGMFTYCSGLTSLNVSGFDTSCVDYANNMFDGCTMLTDLDVSNFDMSMLYVADGMFRDCSSLTALDLSNWNACELTSADAMFSGCKNLVTIGDFNVNMGIQNIHDMFKNCGKLSANVTLGSGNVIYDGCMSGAATAASAQIVVNYGGGVSAKIAQAVVDTKSKKSKVVLGGVIPMIAVTKIVNAAKGIEISWNTQNDVDYYEVYRITMFGFGDGGAELMDIIENPATKKYVDTEVYPGEEYQYFVIGVSGDRAYPFVKSADLIRMESTSIDSISNTAKGMTISWDPVDDAVGYYVYRSKGTGAYKKVKTLKDDVWTDTAANENGAKYSYKVVAYGCRGCAYCAGDNESGLKDHEKTNLYESAASAVKFNYYLTVPASLALKNTTAKALDVSWKKNAKATGYEVQYSLKSGFPKGTNTKNVKITKAKTVKTTIKKLTKKKTYYVRIRAYKTVSKKNYYSAWSGSKKLKITK